MTKRVSAPVEKTLMCAVKLWSIDRGRTPTLLQGVRHVVRKQGHSPAHVDRAIRELTRRGAITISGGRSAKTIKLNDDVSCGNVKLAPWTDDGYPGANLAGSRKRRRKGR